MRVVYSYNKGQFKQAIADIQQPIASAATRAMIQTADLAKAAGRASIAAAGFSSKWQNALRANVFPREKESISVAAQIYHKIPYSEIFETGGTIAGSPLLWLPIEANLPIQSGGRRWTPKDFAAKVGPLRMITRPGKPPLLIAQVAARKGKRVRGAFVKQQTKSLPVFVGVPLVSIGKKFDVTAAVRGAAERFPALYQQNMDGS